MTDPHFEQRCLHHTFAYRAMLAASIVVAQSGCTSWSRAPDSSPTPQGERRQIWRSGAVLILDKVFLSSDSLVGESLDSAKTRIAVARKDVDSMRVQRVDSGKVIILGTGLAILLYFIRFAGFSNAGS